MSTVKSVWLVKPEGYIHSEAFREVATGFYYALNVPMAIDPKTHYSAPLVFGAHLTDGEIIKLPADAVIYQTEQIDTLTGNAWMTNHYLQMLREHEVWDYSHLNVQRLKGFGIEAKYVPIGYCPSMGNIELDQEKKIDVLFYGSLNIRRERILNDLKKTGLNIFTLFGKYGAERDKYIAQSKLVLNLHYYQAAIFEIIRCSHLFANKVCVVSEYGADKELEKPYYNAALFCNYDNIVETCHTVLKLQDGVQNVAEAGFEIFSKVTQKHILQERGLL
jgi:hypothetical protein